MKNKLLAGFLVSLILTLFYSCVKQAPLLIDKSTQGAYLSFLGNSSSAPGKFDYNTIATSTVSVKVKSVGAPVDKVNIYVGTSPDKSTWKKIKTVPFTDSATLSVSGAELAAAIGVTPSALTPGNNYIFYNEIVTKDGRTFSATNTNDDFQGQSSYNIGFVFSGTVFCSFDRAVFTGTFKVVRDDWQDFGIGDPVTVNPGPSATQITIIAYPAPQAGGANRKPMILDVDPATNLVTVKEQVYGDYPPTDFNVSAKGTGTVNSCTKTISLKLTHIEGGSTLAKDLRLVLQK